VLSGPGHLQPEEELAEVSFAPPGCAPVRGAFNNVASDATVLSGGSMEASSLSYLLHEENARAKAIANVPARQLNFFIYFLILTWFNFFIYSSGFFG
jgi:hypothetical protein